MTIPNEVEDGLLKLLYARVAGFETLIEVAQKLSAQGVSRPELVDFFYRFIRDHEAELDEDQVDVLGDTNIHLAGQQCSLGQIIRLDGDPEDPVQLAEKVHNEMRGWRPPG